MLDVVRKIVATGVYGERLEIGSGLPSEARFKRETTFNKRGVSLHYRRSPRAP